MNRKNTSFGWLTEIVLFKGSKKPHTHAHVLKKYPYDKNHSEAVYLMKLKSINVRQIKLNIIIVTKEEIEKQPIQKRVRKHIMHICYQVRVTFPSHRMLIKSS